MNNISFLYNENTGSIKIEHLRDNAIDYKSDVEMFDFYELRRLIKFFSSVKSKFKITINLKYNIIYSKRIEFADKLTYILLECLLYDLVINKSINLNLNMQYKHTIKTEGVKYSSLKYINNKEEFKKRFLNEISMYHYRNMIDIKSTKDKPQKLSLILSELELFLITCGIERGQSKQLAEISVELIDNALEHSQSDCLFDIDVTERTYRYETESNDRFMAVSIAVLDFSEATLGLGIKSMVNGHNCDTEPYQKLKSVEKIHKNYFGVDYDVDQFYLLSTFQNKITSRSDSKATGGKGLTKLIKGLQEDSETDICYVVSRDICLFFRKDQIRQDSDKWVGFNKENDCKKPPDKESLKKSPVNIIGTAYNLTFVLKKEK